MRALVADHSAVGRLQLSETPDPVPGADEVLIRVAAFSLNYGELPKADGLTPDGTVPGWDTAGVIERAAASGRGPKVGDRVVAFKQSGGGWAELRAVHIDEVAVLPDEVTFGQAATLPTAAVTALRALRRGGLAAGKRVAVTGASGGVGTFAVQLAHLAGAEVYALVGSRARGEGLAGLGADHVVTGAEEIDQPIDLVLDNVGGPLLTGLLGRLAEHAVVVSVGATSGEPTEFAAYQLLGGEISLHGFRHGGSAGADLAELSRLVAEGHLRTAVDWEGDWSEAGEAALALLDRRIRGKAVLTIG
ncbi:zinc-binding dehydrogenase [Kitasatospora sp. NPDC056138]|uniref:zinc-binding dehydrogenase n=1 Tax=Kitasatospora sp. NPDC056138 TaxID=3345724 RepID=UPI0035DAFB4F